ncbi:MAG: AAA family ATPase [Bacteroidaceae bacterium]|nr:AAA family ATPase [Bacteroidaceae bacterium]MBO4841221.1 AAA family ATPase [Bacteroidaceae bacterium]
MSKYAEYINRSSCRSINEIIDLCHEMLPEQWKFCPWRHPELIHGIGLLASEEALNCYMSAYGEMHVGKCRAAFINFPFDILTGSIEIVDWGCGQGIGSATLIEALQQRELLNWVKKITLVEPSPNALHRAVCNISKIVNNNIEIDAINKFMPTKEAVPGEILASIGYRYYNVIHIFSNILDVKAIDLAAVAHMVASSHGNHYILCMGPQNSAAYRIEQFCSVFGNQEYFSRIDSVRYGRTQRTGHPYTCKTRCFKYNGAPLDLSKLSLYHDSGEQVFNDYDIQLQWQNKMMSREKARVAYRLQNILSVDDIMYIDPVINEVAVDFIIVRPNRGLLLLNVFEENLDDCQLSKGGKDISVLGENGVVVKTYQSPIELINLCQISIKDGIEELLMSTIENSRNFGLIKKIVVFTANDNNKVRDFFSISSEQISYTYLFGNEFISKKDVSQGLYTQIGLINTSLYFDDAVKRKIAKILSPSWHSYQEGKAGIEPKGAQKELVISRNTQQKISGVAGSGKTHVLAARAVNAMKRTGGDVLVLTFNITLANYLKYRLSELREDFSWEKIDIYPYHQFFRIRASECQLHVDFDAYDRLSFFENATIHKHYSAIFVDEVQDYTTEWLRIVMQNFLLPDGEFVVFGDPKQNVYHRPIDINGDIRLGVIGGEWNKKLSTGRRFTNPRLATLATTFQAKYLSNQPVSTINTTTVFEATLNFQIVTYYNMRNSFTMDNLLLKLIEIIKNSNSEPKDFVVLASYSKLLQAIDSKYREMTEEETEITFVSIEQYERLKKLHNVSDEHPASWKFNRDYEALGRTRKQLFTTDKRCLKLSTIKSFKGWESPSVIIILDDEYNAKAACRKPMDPEMMYTAITRARESLYIINIGNETYDQFFKEQAI